MLGNKEEKKMILIYKELAKLISREATVDRIFNRYEYYKRGGIPLRKALSLVYDMQVKGLINQREYGILHKYLEDQLILGASRNKEFILSTYYQFGDYVISEEEKQMIWHSINELGLEDKDIDDLVFSAAVREYAISKGLIKNKKRVLNNKKRSRF